MKKILLALALTLTLASCSSTDSKKLVVIGTQLGTMQESTLKEYALTNTNIEIAERSTNASIIQDVKAGRIDALICEEAVANEIVSLNSDLVINSFDYNSENEVKGNAIAINKENTELLDQINESLSTLKENGKLDELIDEFFGSDATEITKSTVNDANTSEEVLIVGTSSGYPPYEVVDVNGNLGGFDIELAEEIGLLIKKKIEWLDVDYSALTPGLLEGKFDLIIAGISPTAERAKEVNFSTPYYIGDEENVINVLVSLKTNEITFESLQN